MVVQLLLKVWIHKDRGGERQAEQIGNAQIGIHCPIVVQSELSYPSNTCVCTHKPKTECQVGLGGILFVSVFVYCEAAVGDLNLQSPNWTSKRQTKEPLCWLS